MKRLSTRLLVIPALLLLSVSEANAQRRGGVGISIGTGGFGGFNPGFGGFNNGFNPGFGGFNNGFNPGFGGFNNGFNPGFGGFNNGFGRGTGFAISLGGNNNWNGYGNNWNGYNNWNRGSYGYNTGYSYPTYSTGAYSGYNSPTYSTASTRYNTGYSNQAYSTASMPTTSTSFYQPTYQPTYSTNGITQMSYTSPSYSTDSGVVQASNWSSPSMSYQGMAMTSSTPAVAKIKMTLPSGADVWVDDKQLEGSGTTREYTSATLSSVTNVKVKVKSGETTREFTMPVRPGEDSTFDVSQLLR